MIRGGKSYVSARPAFSNDAKRLLVCTGDAVSIFSTSTGLLISTLEGHNALVTSVIVVPASSLASKDLCFCWTASLDGTIRYWDFSAPELRKTINCNMPIYSMVIPSLLGQPVNGEEKPSKDFAYVSIGDMNVQENKAKAQPGQIRKCNLTESRMLGERIILGKTERPESITISPSGKFFGIQSKHKLLIWKVPATDSNHAAVKKISLHHTKNLEILAFHPTSRIVAAGDESGRILIWRGFGRRTFPIGDKLENGRLVHHEEERPGVRGDDDADSCSTWHWHATQVNVLSFSSDGAYLYSGGKEGVLVVWQLDTGKKKFLPRIGSPLRYFIDSPDPTLSSISCADNRILILKLPSMEILKSISGIKRPCLFPEVNEAPCSKFAFGHSAGLVALPTENYCIQLYSLFDDREISEIQVCERNHQPGDDITVLVSLLALSQDGSMMCTTEVKLPEEGIGALVCLKFWASLSQNKNFCLSTIIYEPHRDAGISAVAFHPTRKMAVSSSYGGDFKIWVCKDNIQQKPEMPTSSGWMCHAVGSYKKKPMTALAFSGDGSVLAVAAETVITLWDPEKNVLVAVIGEMLEPIMNLSFVGDSLVSVSQGSKPQLSVWSISNLSVSWSYKLQVEDVASAVDLSLFAVLVLQKSSTSMGSNELTFQGRDGLILLFNSTDPVPLAAWSVRKASGGGIAFIQGNQPSFEQNISELEQSKAIVYMNSDHEYFVFDPFDNKAPELSLNRREGFVASEETARFGYASLYGELPEFELKKNQNALAPSGASERRWETIFSGPSHNLPPLTKLCSEFLESLLEKRTVAVE
ncbi:uncharacterized protein LOC107432272 [Ziziphus jujuba]|uniref:Uncharacterized protein LOC107432272 n=1 Tax=Ziziphus jujuba TaxID=326968 RepID=A0A6P4AU89_ZIZJJ|nr:uncharacterized protein LOC107432272 [Ziziphus jujuba]